MKCLRLKIYGTVQGVFFRQRTMEKARELGVNGTVKNCPDGSVEVQAEAQPEIMEQFIEWCRKGPSRAQVSTLDIHEETVHNFDDFRIIR